MKHFARDSKSHYVCWTPCAFSRNLVSKIALLLLPNSTLVFRVYGLINHSHGPTGFYITEKMVHFHMKITLTLTLNPSMTLTRDGPSDDSSR